MTAAEAAATFVTGLLASVVIAGYLVDAAGLGLQSWVALVIAIVVAAIVAREQRRRDPGGLVIWIAVCGVVGAALLRNGAPGLLLPGRGPDLAHHLLLVDYIERAGHLVHDRSLDGTMGEMAHYTPGAHLLAVSVGRWFGVDALRAFFPLLVVCAALSAGFVLLMARRLALPMSYAIGAVALVFLPAQYFSGAFTHDSFLAQSVATCFAVAAWWALVAFDQRPSTVGAARAGLFLAAVFLSWPIFIGPLVIVLLALVYGGGAERWQRLGLALLPLATVAAVHIVGRWGWLVIVRTSGAVLEPNLANLGWLLPLLALAGLWLSATDRRARPTVILLVMIGVQAITLYVIATSQGASTPYMAYKMVYFAIYPMAVLAAYALGSRDPNGAVGWLVAAVLLAVAVRPALTAPRVVPVVDRNLYEAGRWTRANVGTACVDYLVADAETAYWLHLAVLGNPRASERMVEIDRYDPRAALAPWITAAGRGFAIADMRLLPAEVRSRVEIVNTFGHAAVIKQPGATCYNGGL